MNKREETVRRYLAAMAACDLDGILECFEADGLVSSPVYGGVPVADFYRKLLADTAEARVSVHQVYVGTDAPDQLAASFDYYWAMTDGRRTQVQLVDLFEFRPGSDKIQHLTIVFDTGKIGNLSS